MRLSKPSSETHPSPNQLSGLPSPCRISTGRFSPQALHPFPLSAGGLVAVPPRPERAVPIRAAERHRPSRHTESSHTTPRGHPPGRWPRRTTSPHRGDQKVQPSASTVSAPQHGQGLTGNPKRCYITWVASSRAKCWRAAHELQHLDLVGSVVISFFSPFLSLFLNFAFIASSCSRDPTSNCPQQHSLLIILLHSFCFCVCLGFFNV